MGLNVDKTESTTRDIKPYLSTSLRKEKNGSEVNIARFACHGLHATVCMPRFAYFSLGVYINIPLSFKAFGTTIMLPIRPVSNCLLNFRPTFTATTSFVSFEGFETSIITRNITLTLPLLNDGIDYSTLIQCFERIPYIS